MMMAWQAHARRLQVCTRWRTGVIGYVAGLRAHVRRQASIMEILGGVSLNLCATKEVNIEDRQNVNQ